MLGTYFVAVMLSAGFIYRKSCSLFIDFCLPYSNQSEETSCIFGKNLSCRDFTCSFVTISQERIIRLRWKLKVTSIFTHRYPGEVLVHLCSFLLGFPENGDDYICWCPSFFTPFQYLEYGSVTLPHPIFMLVVIS